MKNNAHHHFIGCSHAHVPKYSLSSARWCWHLAYEGGVNILAGIQVLCLQITQNKVMTSAAGRQTLLNQSVSRQSNNELIKVGPGNGGRVLLSCVPFSCLLFIYSRFIFRREHCGPRLLPLGPYIASAVSLEYTWWGSVRFPWLNKQQHIRLSFFAHLDRGLHISSDYHPNRDKPSIIHLKSWVEREKAALVRTQLPHRSPAIQAKHSDIWFF